MTNRRRWSRREFLGTVAAASGAASWSGMVRPETLRSARKPNVRFLMSDDMRVEIGCHA
jgi:hypothetical protein